MATSVASWAPHHLHSNAPLIRSLQVECDTLLTESSKSNGTVKNRDLGFTFAVGGSVDHDILREIARRHHDEQLVPCISIGAGQGEMEHMMLIAGAKLDLVEQNRDVAQACVERLRQAVRYLPHNVSKLEQVAHMYVTDAMGKHVGIQENKYDVLVARQFLHMLYPSNVMPFFARIYNMLRPGGIAFLTCMSPSCDGSSTRRGGLSASEVLTLQRDKGEPYPGFMVALQTSQEFRLRTMISPATSSTSSTSSSSVLSSVRGKTIREYQVMTHPTARVALPNTTLARDPFRLVQRGVALRDFPVWHGRETTQLPLDAMGDVWESTHLSVNSVFDVEMLRAFAKQVGLDVVDAFYADDKNERYHTASPSPEEFNSHYMSCAIRLIKPKNGPSRSAVSPNPAEIIAVEPEVSSENSDNQQRPTSWKGLSIPTSLVLTDDEKKRAAAYRASMRMKKDHVCDARCKYDRPMNMVIAAIQAVLPADAHGSRLSNKLIVLQHRFALAGYGTPEQQALMQTLFETLSDYTPSVMPEGSDLNTLVRNLVNGVENYLEFIPAAVKGGAIDLTPGDETASSISTSFRARWMQMSMDELALECNLVPLPFILERLEATKIQRCRARRGY